MERKVAAILMADVAEYSRLMEADETATHMRHMALRSGIIDSAVAAYRGRIVDTAGDGFVAAFCSVADAAGCAIHVQRAVRMAESSQPVGRGIAYRMGLNHGDILVEGADVFGTTVNLAARLQELSAPGGLLVSASVYDNLASDEMPPTVDLGFLLLKNIKQPVHAYRVLVDPGRHPADIVPSYLSKGRAAIAVLPFHTLDADLSQTYFGDGIVDDIITSLSALRELPVIARGSTLAYRSEAVDPRRVGRDLGVRYVLSGTVRRDPRRLRITTELADTQDSSVLWSHRYDVLNDALFEVQDRITAEIVNTTMPHLRAAEVSRARLKRPDNLDAYEYYLQGLDLLYRLDLDSFAQASAHLLRAIALDANYANGYALAADWHAIRVAQGWSPDPAADWAEAIRLAEAAVARDGMNARALALLGHYRSFLTRDYDAALELLGRAQAANPVDARVWGLSAPTHNYLGDGRTAIEFAERAIRLSPQDPWAFWAHTSIAIAHYTLGAYEEAVHWGQIATRGSPNYLASLLPTAAAWGALGRAADAQVTVQNLLRIAPRFSVATHIERHPYRDLARRTALQGHLLAAGLPP